MPSNVHDYETQTLRARDLAPEHVLVGESGGLSAVYAAGVESEIVPGLMTVTTEHGQLLTDPDKDFDVLDM